MPTLLIGVLALALGVGTLLFSRTARADSMNDENTNTDTDDDRPRAIRNNNPLNLEYHGIGWIGEIGTDGRYSIFDTPLNGMRAGMRNMHTKFFRDGINTVRELVTVWAPAHENPTESYITFVATSINAAPDEPLNWHAYVIPLSKAMARFEIGYQPYADSFYREAYQATGKAI